MALETISIPKRVAYWVRLPNHNVRVFLASAAEAPGYGEVFARGLDWPSLASAVTALEVEGWSEIAQPIVDDVVLEKTA